MKRKSLLTMVFLLLATSLAAQNPWFAWEDLTCSGARKIDSAQRIALKARGGAGWYWAEGRDLSACGQIRVELSQALTQSIRFVVLYGDETHSEQTLTQVAAGTKTFGADLTAAHTEVYAVAFVADNSVSVFLDRVYLTDKAGNELTAVGSPAKDEHAPDAAYDLTGRPVGTRPGAQLPKGIYIVNGKKMVMK